MLKKVLSVFLIFVIICSCTCFAAADYADIGIYFNDKKLELSKNTYVKNGIIMCELQGVFDAMGISYEYLGVSETLNASYRGDKMVVKMGEKSMTVHRVPIELTEPFYRDGNKIMMPLDTVAYCFNLIVDRTDLSHIVIKEKERVKTESFGEKLEASLKEYQDKKNVAFEGTNDYIEKVNLTQYPDYETLKIVDVEGMHFDKALDVTVTKTPDNWWEKQIIVNIPDYGRTKDELVLVTFWGKSLWARTDAATAKVAVCDQTAAPDYHNVVTQQIDLTNEWQKYYIVAQQGTSVEAIAGKHSLNFRFGFALQQFQLADIRVEYYTVPSDFEIPEETPNYEGIEDDAIWRKEALKSIEKNRKNNMVFNVVDDKGNPIENADIHAEMTRSEMNWGVSTGYEEYTRTGQNAFMLSDRATKHQQMLKDLGFNMVTLPLNKPGSIDNQALEREINYLLDNDLDYRLHCYVWDGLDPESTQRLYLSKYRTRLNWDVDYMDKSDYRKIWEDQVNLLGSYAGNYPAEIDVLNEVSPRHYVLQYMGYGEIKRYFELARKLNPDAKLVLNECGVGGYSVGKGYFDSFLELVKYLKSIDTPIDAAGMQAHQVSANYPYLFYEEAELLTQYVDSVSITEFDVGLKEVYLYPYVRDVLIACYAHPKINTFVVWTPFYIYSTSTRLEFLYGYDDKELPGLKAWKELVKGEWWTDEKVKTDEHGTATIRGHRGRYDVTVSVNGKSETISMNLTTDEDKNVINAVVSENRIELKCENEYIPSPKKKYVNSLNFGSTTDTDMPALINEYERTTEIVSCTDFKENELPQLFDEKSDASAEILPGEYLTVELGKAVDLKKIIVGWGDGYLKRFSNEIEISSDGENWTLVRNGINKSANEEIDMTGRNAKYIRIKATDEKVIVGNVKVYTDNSKQ